jgi:hypothetical protein
MPDASARRDAPVFVDESGRRARWMRRAGAGFGVLFVAYLALVIAGLMGASFVDKIGVPRLGRLDREPSEASTDPPVLPNGALVTTTAPPPTAEPPAQTATTAALVASATAPPTTPTTAVPTTPTSHGPPVEPPGQGRRP